MSDTKVKISELPSVSEVLGTDESPAVQSSTTKKFTMTQLGSYILGAFSGLSLGGVAQTAKAAIDAVTTALGNLSDLVGNTAMGTTATTVTGAIAEHEGDITSLKNSLSDTYKWNSTPLTLNNVGQFTAFIDGIYTSSGRANGFHFGYIQAVDAANIGLQNTGFYFMTFANSTNYRIVIALTTTGTRWYSLYKSDGTWQSTWNTVVTP